MDCTFAATGRARPGTSEYQCTQCGFIRWSKYEPRLIHRHCQMPDGSSPVEQGPGTELKKLLAGFGIFAESGCGCDDHAREMNRRGVEWCKANVDTIVGWMREEAGKRGLPFVEIAAKWLVRQAIRSVRAP
jgi:hypothetical protein